MSVSPTVMADAIRVLAMDAVEAANSGHPGMPMGMADVATVLWTRFLKFDPKRPDWPDRDRFVLSAGHGSMLLYALLHLTGSQAVTMDQLRRFRQLGAITAGHPEYGHVPGVETTTGPLGQGLATAVGMAMAERHLNARFGGDLVDHRTWVVCGDGDLMEGISQEAIALAGRLKLNRLTVLWDDNGITIDGAVALSETGDQLARFKAAGWAVKAVNGHDQGAVRRALAWANKRDRPTLIACKTKIGKGAATLEGRHDTHGKALGAAEVAATRRNLGWTLPPFELPPEIAEAWLKAGRRAARPRAKWDKRLKGSARRAEFQAAMMGDVPAAALEALQAHIDRQVQAKPAAATRVHSGSALSVLIQAIPEMVGGSADLTGSVNTLVDGMGYLDAPDYVGRYVNYGIREHAMAAAMNGMALHGGVIPYAGTFLVFSDYSRPAIRLGALMGVRVVHVMTHDSIGLGARESHPVRLRHGARHRASGPPGAGGRGHTHPRGLHPLLGAVRRPAGGLSQAGHRRRSGAAGGRSGGPPGLGPVHRRARRLHRHDRLRRQRPGRAALRALRHHPAGGGRRREGETGRGLRLRSRSGSSPGSHWCRRSRSCWTSPCSASRRPCARA